MALTLYYHPLASFCWKPLIALYENGTPFTPLLVDLGDEKSRGEFHKIWPLGEFPVLRDEANGRIIPQSAIIVQYLDLHHPGRVRLLPVDADERLEAHRWDGFYDSYVHQPMQKIVLDCLRPEGAPEGSPEGSSKDPLGVAEARATLATAYGILEAQMSDRAWAIGGAFSMADCSAAPALFYGDWVQPLGSQHPKLAAYLERLKARPSFARVLKEAEPYFHLVPYRASKSSKD